ncbi:MAG: DUF2029 domain-containing protein [Planctomycetes bacterium]|nr:DUF2029 domain-containing protein [Planctomycetota bacterium]
MDHGGSGPRSRASELLLALAVAVFALASVVEYAKSTVGIDYYLYWATGLAVEQREIRDVYDPGENERVGRQYFQAAQAEARGRGAGPQGTRRLAAANVRKTLDNYSTPFLYALFGFPLSGDYDRDLAAMQYASIALHVVGVLALARALRYSLVASALALALTTMLAGPFIDDLNVANVNRLQVGGLGLAGLLLARRNWVWSDVWAGTLLGVAVLFKPNLAYAVVALLAAWIATAQARRIVQLALGGALACGLAAAVSAAWFGSLKPWLAWPTRLEALMPTWASEVGNQSLARVLHDRSGLDATSWLPIAFLGLACGAFLVARIGRGSGASAAPTRADGELEIAALGLGAVASVLATKLVWFHYYLLCVPLALWLLRPRDGRLALRVAVLVAFVLAMTDIPRKVLPSAWFEPSLAIVIGALAMFALGLVEARRAAREALGLQQATHASG